MKKLSDRLDDRFPVSCESKARSKVPKLQGWKNIEEKTIYSIQENIDNPRGPLPYCLKTGRCNNLTVIDLDINKSKDDKLDDKIDGAEWFKQNFPKELKKNFVVSTPSGGIHVYYQYCSQLKNSNFALHDSRVRFEVRNDQSYVMGASGLGYLVINDVEELEEVPQEIIDMIKKQNKF